jgi:site-specific recombinase XerD
VERYREYLIVERGLASATICSYVEVARIFLSRRSAESEDLALAALTPPDVVDFVLRECRGRSKGSAAYVVCGLRSLLRFLYVEGRTLQALADAVPKVPSWKLAWLPRSLGSEEVSRLLKSCDRRRATGRRDFAILTLLVRLGLRRGEVAALRLADFDWRAGEILIRGKGSREERLPMPVDVGEAVVSWLQRGRPKGRCAQVFTRRRAPITAMSPGAVSHVVMAAAARAGLQAVSAHRLRHTAATEMLRAGAGLAEVGQVLRHHSQLTTAIYAKVDQSALRAVAQPWPEVRHE